MSPFVHICLHCCFRHLGNKFQFGPNLDLSKALNNGYCLLLFRIEGYLGHFGFLLIKIYLLAFRCVTEKWTISPKIQKNLFSCSDWFKIFIYKKPISKGDLKW